MFGHAYSVTDKGACSRCGPLCEVNQHLDDDYEQRRCALLRYKAGIHEIMMCCSVIRMVIAVASSSPWCVSLATHAKCESKFCNWKIELCTRRLRCARTLRLFNFRRSALYLLSRAS